MSNAAPKLEPTPANHTKASTSRKLIQAAAFAAFLVPLGSVAVETASISCGFGTSYGNTGSGSGCTSSSSNSNRFDFGAYFFELTFILDPSGSNFTVRVNTTDMTQSAFAAKAGAFPGYTCIALTAGGPCVDFEVVPSVGQVGNWTHYQMEIHWGKITGQALDPALMTILHDIGTTGTRDYDEDMCLNPLNDPCVIDPDPGIRSGDTDFRSFIAAERSATVPEPSSLILLGTGVSGFLFHRRLRRQKPEAEPTA